MFQSKVAVPVGWRGVYFFPVAVTCAAMVSASLLAASLGGVLPFGAIVGYSLGAAAGVILATLVFIFIRLVALARVMADEPLRIILAELRGKLPGAVLPLVLFPVFLGSYTAAKESIPMLVGYHLDAAFTALDIALLGTDAWRLTHGLIGVAGTAVIEFLYYPVWLMTFACSMAMVPFLCARAFVGRFYLAMMLTWFLGGFVGAYLLSSAGPLFVHLVDPALGEHFAPLRAGIASLVPPDSVFAAGAAYLEAGYRSGGAMSGGGISAMPSMHIATVAIYALAAKGTRLFWPALAFALTILVGSVHSGNHYLVDAPAAALIAFGCWNLAALIYPPKASIPDTHSRTNDWPDTELSDVREQRNLRKWLDFGRRRKRYRS